MKYKSMNAEIIKVDDYEVITSYYTPIAFVHNNIFVTTDAKYSRTTSKQKTVIKNDLYEGHKVVLVPQKVFNNIMRDLGVGLGWAE